MADIELVIDIPEDMYNDANILIVKDLPVLRKIIANGVPLPKGHGRLIDADEIQFENSEFDTYGDYSRAFDAIDTATTIIKADKEAHDEIYGDY